MLRVSYAALQKQKPQPWVGAFVFERVMGLEPTTLILGRFCATIAPHPLVTTISSKTFVQATIVFSKAMTSWTEHFQVFRTGMFGVAIYMMYR